MRLGSGISGQYKATIKTNSHVSLLLLVQTVQLRRHILWLQKDVFEMAKKKIFFAAKLKIELKHGSLKMS